MTCGSGGAGECSHATGQGHPGPGPIRQVCRVHVRTRPSDDDPASGGAAAEQHRWTGMDVSARSASTPRPGARLKDASSFGLRHREADDDCVAWARTRGDDGGAPTAGPHPCADHAEEGFTAGDSSWRYAAGLLTKTRARAAMVALALATIVVAILSIEVR